MSDVEIIVETGPGLLTDPAWDALVDAVGTPFHSGRFLLPWWRDTSAKDPDAQLIGVKLVDGRQVVGVCAFELSGGRLAFAGGRDVVDYMGPLAAGSRVKEVAEALMCWVFELGNWNTARFGGLVQAEAMTGELIEAAGRRTSAFQVEVYDQVPVIDAAPDGYLALLNSKKRVEVQRKRNRLIEEAGDLQVTASTPQTLPRALERLLAWKSAAGAPMADFVTQYEPLLRELLGGLAEHDRAHVMELCAGSRALASAIVLTHRNTRYLYNMSYDLALTSNARIGLAPGVVLVSYLAEQALDAGLGFDFLKGAQEYKLRLGGIPRDLVEITIER